ncbi:MAG: hypothetical protein RIT19_997 [Verrucomicrobiota bacterium]
MTPNAPSSIDTAPVRSRFLIRNAQTRIIAGVLAGLCLAALGIARPLQGGLIGTGGSPGGDLGKPSAPATFQAKSGGAALPVITLQVSPHQVPEDSNQSLTFTFSRTGSTANPLGISVLFGGTASGTPPNALFPGDFTASGDIVGFAGTSAGVSFAAGSATATVTIDPILDTVVEPDETVLVTVAGSPFYTVGTAAAATGVITNDDGTSGDPPGIGDATTAGSITPTSAVLGGEVISDGKLPISERGIMLAPPDAADPPILGLAGVSRLQIAGGIGAFSVTASGLKPDTQYRFRAYAINAAGTRYGPVATFRTLDNTTPVAFGDEVVTAEDSPLEVLLAATDPSGKPLGYSIEKPPANGKLGPITGDRVRYFPKPGFRGNDVFTFRVNNGISDSAPAAITVSVVTRPVLQVTRRSDTKLTVGIRAHEGALVDIESLLPHAGWRSTGQQVVGLGEAVPVPVDLRIAEGEPARLWRARQVSGSGPAPAAKVDVEVGLDAAKAITYTINGKPSPDGEIRVLAGGAVNFFTKLGKLTVTIEPVRVLGIKLLLAVATVESETSLVCQIPKDAADQDEYKYSVTIVDAQGNIFHHDPKLRIFN